VSIQWAQENNAEIICADAPLVYRGMNIGSAKPTPDQQAQVPHHAIDWIDVTQNFSVGDYALRVKQIVDDIRQRGKQVLVVGGSGFYLKSFFMPVVDGIELTKEAVALAQGLYNSDGLPGLISRLREFGDDLDGLDLNNPRRVIKALERCLSSGLSYRALKDRFDTLPAPYDDFSKSVTLITRTKEDLRARISLRIDQMLSGGLIDEVSALRDQGIEKNTQAASVIDYREVLAYLRGDVSFDQLKPLMIDNTLELVRKQIIFFKQLPVDRTLLLGPQQKATPAELFA